MPSPKSQVQPVGVFVEVSVKLAVRPEVATAKSACGTGGGGGGGGGGGAVVRQFVVPELFGPDPTKRQSAELARSVILKSP